MTGSLTDQAAFEELEIRLKAILPEEYQDCYEDLAPVSMGSASLIYGRDGKVAWNEIWETFCDLAMAGGPPHKGKLLEPGSRAEIDAEPVRYREVVEEICRGVKMVAECAAEPSSNPGWVRMHCESPGMAEWLVRAIVIENVSARAEGAVLNLPAGPAYRIEKEIKNVITVVAKTRHYWIEHMWPSQQREIANLFAKMAAESPLVQPALSNHNVQADRHETLRGRIAEAVQFATGLEPSSHQYAGWLGFVCPDVRDAIRMMRALVVSNVLSRREETVLFVPVNPVSDPDGETVVRLLVRTYRFAAARKML